MKIIRVTYFALATLFSVASCSKEATEPDVYDWGEGKIYFKPSISDVAGSRAQDMTLDRLESFQVTCFNTTDILAGDNDPYFENSTFIRRENIPTVTTFVSSPAEEPHDWPANGGLMRFFAFSPSLTSMAYGNSAVTDADKYFNLINRSSIKGSSASIRYGLSKVRINPDITKQFDFVTAEASGERWKDFTGGVELSFRHQLCQVELRAWGADSEYDFEIAGVRIGNPIVEGTFVFADDSQPTTAGSWRNATIKGNVEYLYRGVQSFDTDEQAWEGDRIFRINKYEHNSAESAASIMGNGGTAMIIPTVNEKWEGTDDPNTAATPYKTDKMYFSILMRVTDPDTGSLVYPYPGNNTGMTVISYAVDSSGKIIKRLYAGETEGTYYTDSDLKNPYMAEDGEKEEILDFGWAAVPVDADWSAGKRYVYTLNYSEGIGIHDPSDPEPGKLIVGQTPIEWSVSISNWEYAEKDENYNPDLDVPGFEE